MENNSEKRVPLTLCVVHQAPRVLLGMKKRGFGAGRWNGFGGKLLEGETIMDALMREMKEEVGVILANPVKVGIIDFRFQNKPGEVLTVHIFRATQFSGEPVESEEMRPQWFEEGSIPFEDMWSDDKYWVPLFLAGKKFRGEFLFDESDGVFRHELVVIDEF